LKDSLRIRAEKSRTLTEKTLAKVKKSSVEKFNGCSQQIGCFFIQQILNTFQSQTMILWIIGEKSCLVFNASQFMDKVIRMTRFITKELQLISKLDVCTCRMIPNPEVAPFKGEKLAA